MGETETPHFYDFGTFGHVPEPQHQYHLPLETPRYFKQSKKDAKSFLKSIICINLFVENPTVWFVRNGGHRKIPTAHLIQSWKSWIWDQYLSKNMTWKFGNMGSLNLWNFEILKPRDFETRHRAPLKPRNQKTNSRTTTKQPRNQSTSPSKGIPRTPQHSDSTPCTRPPTFRKRARFGCEWTSRFSSSLHSSCFLAVAYWRHSCSRVHRICRGWV